MIGVLVLVLVAVAGLGMAYAWTRTQYFVGADRDQVAIFQGLSEASRACPCHGCMRYSS